MSTTRSEIIQQAKILKSLIALSEADIILNNFVYSFMNRTIDKGDGVVYLHGNFNLGGTVSGRLSSSKVNLNNRYTIKYNNQCDDNIKMIVLVLYIWQLYILLQGFIRVILCRKLSKRGNSN